MTSRAARGELDCQSHGTITPRFLLRVAPDSEPPPLHLLNFRADDGEELRVWQHGDAGPIIVFLHGWTASHLEWSPFVHALEKTHRVFRWDARAHGGPPPQTATVATAERMARDLDQMIDAFDLYGGCFVGHSMGSLTLWQYLRDHGSGKIGRLCFIDQSPKLLTDSDWRLGIYGDYTPQRAAQVTQSFRDDFAEGVLRFTAYGLNELARARYQANGRGWQRLRDYLRGLPADALIACWEDLVQVDFRSVIPRIDRPTLLVYGGRSNFYLPETCPWLAARIADCRSCIYDEADHSPHLADPARFIAQLAAFAAS